jgi:hypothetical protein
MVKYGNLKVRQLPTQNGNAEVVNVGGKGERYLIMVEDRGQKGVSSEQKADKLWLIADGGLQGLERSRSLYHIRDMMNQLLLTTPGGRLKQPDFGCGLRTGTHPILLV